MKVLLTGGAGYIGSHTAVELIKAGHSVVIADNFSNSVPEAVRRIEFLTNSSVKLYDIDVADREAMRRLFDESRIDAAVHFAGYKSVGESVAKPLMYYRNNIDTALTLMELMVEYGARKLVFSSSATVYGAPESVPLTEESKVGASLTNPYGRSKYMLETIISDASAAHGIETTLLRYFNPVGADESGLIGEVPSGVPNNLMPYITQAAIGERERLHVFGNDYPTRDGTGVRDYIHVSDLALGHVAALEHDGGVFNLGTGRGVSVLELIETFERVNGVEVPYDIVGRRAGDIAECYADATKAERELNWRAARTVEDMCRDSWRFQKMNPRGYDPKLDLSELRR